MNTWIKAGFFSIFLLACWNPPALGQQNRTNPKAPVVLWGPPGVIKEFDDSEADQQVGKLIERIKRLEKAVLEHREQARQISAQLEVAQRELVRAFNNADKFKKRSQEYLDRLDRIGEENRILKKDLKDQQRRSREKSRDQTNQAGKIGNLKNRVTEYEDKLSRIEADSNTGNQALELALHRVDSLSHELEARTVAVTALEKALKNSQAEVQDLDLLQESLSAQNRQMAETVAELRTPRAEVREMENQYVNQIRELEDEVARLDLTMKQKVKPVNPEAAGDNKAVVQARRLKVALQKSLKRNTALQRILEENEKEIRDLRVALSAKKEVEADQQDKVVFAQPKISVPQPATKVPEKTVQKPVRQPPVKSVVQQTPKARPSSLSGAPSQAGTRPDARLGNVAVPRLGLAPKQILAQRPTSKATQPAKGPAPVRSPVSSTGTRKAESPPPARGATKETAGPVPFDKLLEKPAKKGSQSEVYKMVAEGNRRLKMGDVQGGEALFRSALKQNAGLMSARLGLAACHYTMGDLVTAKMEVNALLREEKNNPQALGLRGVISWREGNSKQAQLLLEKAVRVDPNDPQLHNYLAIVHHALKRNDRAIDELRKAVRLDSSHTEALFNLSVLLAMGKEPQIEEAKKHYESSLKFGSARDEKLEKLLYQ